MLARLHQVAKENTRVAWLAITTLCYIGDLSGWCWILRTLPRKAMNLANTRDCGSTFDRHPDEKVFKAAYRQSLDALPIDQGHGVRIFVAEANHAFHLT